VIQGWRRGVPALLLLHVHVVVGVFHKSSRSRRDLGRKVACSISLLADSVTGGLCPINGASNMRDGDTNAILVFL
jgi:hypothetical protein